MNGDEPPHKPAEQHGPDLPAIALDLPPGLSREHIDLVQRAARECREALQNPQTNYPIEQQLPADLLISICKFYETGYGAWEADHLDQIIFARSALKEATDAIRAEHLRNSGDPDAMPSAYDSAKTIIAELNNLYAEVDTAIRNIDPDQVDKAQTLINARRDVAAPRADAETEILDVTTQADALEGEILAAEQANQTVIRNSYSLINIENLHILNGLNITIEKLRASVISVKIAVQNNVIFKGTLKLFNDGLEGILNAAKSIKAKISKASDQIGDAAKQLDTILKPLARVAENGDKLVQTVRQAWTRLFGAKQELPWPTGLRLLPPEGSADDPTEIELVEIRRFETGDGETLGLAPLPGGRFVSGGSDAKLRLWSLDQSEPLARFEGHQDWIRRIAALDETHVVTASDDQTLILWDLEQQKRVRRFGEHDASVGDVAALGPDRFASVASSDLRIWHRDRDDSFGKASFTMARGVAALDPDRIVTGEYDKNDLRVLKVDDGSKIWSNDADGTDIWKAAAVSERSFISAKGGAGNERASELRLWSLDNQQPICTLTETNDVCQDIAALSTTRAVSAHRNGIYYLWSLPDGALLANMKTEAGLLCIRALPREPGGPSRFVCGGNDGYLALWEVRPKS